MYLYLSLNSSMTYIYTHIQTSLYEQYSLQYKIMWNNDLGDHIDELLNMV
jgi:hypothetical protein